MRISDWSSDVCSSDLRISAIDTVGDARSGCYRGVVLVAFVIQNAVIEVGIPAGRYCRIGSIGEHVGDAPIIAAAREAGLADIARHQLERSEEHTSELQSLMRISYAVFCLKKKTNTIRQDEK